MKRIIIDVVIAIAITGGTAIAVAAGFVWVMGTAEQQTRKATEQAISQQTELNMWLNAVARGHAEVYLDEQEKPQFRWKDK